MDNHFEHCSAHVTSLEQDGFLVKIHAQIPSESGVSGRELLSRTDQISGHLRRVKCCESISRGVLAFARIEDNFHRVRALGDSVEGRVAVKFIDFGHEDVLLLSDIIVVDPPLSDVLTTLRPLAEEFYLDGILLMRPLSNEEIAVLSEKILFQTVSCRLRRLHPELSLIELATTNAAGGRRELFSNIVIELGFGNKCSSEDIAKYLRIKIPARADDPAMQTRRTCASNPYSIPPPTLLGSQPTPLLGSQPTTHLGPQPTTHLGPQPTTHLGPQPTSMLGLQPGMTQIPHSSVNARLSRFKKDAALNIPGSGVNLYNQTGSLQPQLADRKQYTVTDGRTCTTAPTLPVNSTHNAYVSHVENGPFNFTIQLKSSVEDLLPKLRNILVRYQNSPITAQLIPGSVVMAKSRDETLRRGVIMNVQPETCKVYYIDFGNFEELPYSDIFQLPNTAAELSPAMAMQFCLTDLKSMKITDSNKDYFARLLLGKQVLIRVTERESNSPFQYCEILWEGRSVREILLNLNSPMQYSYQYPPRGREAPVSVIYVDGPSQFFVQYRSELNVVNQIQEALASYCPSQPRVTDFGAINIGSPVASIFPDDQRWYRALVMGMDTSNVHVFYVDYGNRAEVTPNQICLLSRDLVNQWKTQAIECCLIGFDTVTPDLFLAEKMEEAVLGHSYTLRLHSILSGFRLSVDLLDDQGNSIATNMKNLLNERQKSMTQPTVQTEKKNIQAAHDDDRLSQHSSDSGGKKNKFQRPGTRGDRGNKLDQRGDRKYEERSKFEERSTSYSQHDDRSGNDYKPRNDSRNEWKKGTKKPYMDQESEWDNSNQEPKSYARKDVWGDKQDSRGGFRKNDDKPCWGGDSTSRGTRPDRGDRQGGGFRFDGDRQGTGFRSDGDRQGGGFRSDGDRQGGGFRPDGDRQGGGFRSDGDRKGGSNRFDRKPLNTDEDGRNGDHGESWRSRDRKFGDREKFGDRDNKFGGRENTFGDRENKFGDRENKFGDRDNKFGGRDNRKPKWNDDSAIQRSAVVTEDTWDESEAQAPAKRPSVVISEYPHQEIKVGQEYKVLFAGMETSARDVYVQLSDCDPELDKIRSMIDADTTATSRPISNAVLAMPVLARFQDDGLLYRATIRSISKVPSGQVDVLFVDFGNTAVNALSEVFNMSSELMSIPIQAIHVIVTDMPTTSFPNLAACQAHFDTEYLTLKPSRTTTINLQQVIEGTLIRPDGKSVADCIKNDPSCHEETQIVVATNSQLASPVDVESQDLAPEVDTSVHTPIVLWRERLDLLLGQQLLAKVVKKCGDDDLYSIRITAVLGLIVPAQSVDTLSPELTQGADVIVAVDALAEDRLMVKFYNRQGHSLGKEDAIGELVPMQIVQRQGIYTVSHQEASTLYLQQEDSVSLSDLLERLFEKYEDSASGSYQFKVGDVCAAKSFDGNWYRAKVSTIVENMYTVHYVDYGNNEDVKAENLRKLDEEFINSPEMCVRVILPVTYKDVEGCVGTLGEGPFECTFIKRDPVNGVWVVDLCTIGEVKENFALKWVEAGKAESMSNLSADPKRREPSWNLKKGDRVPIFICHIELLDDFYAIPLELSSDVQSLQDKIQALPEGGDVGDVFIARYPQDSMWYRAVRFGDEVRFIDYGNHDQSFEFKNLPADLIHPAKGYAMPLRLCVRASGTEPAAHMYDDFIDKSGLEAEIISVDFETIVDLRVGDESLSRMYVDGGHAVHFDPPLHNGLGGCVFEDDIPVGKVSASVSTVNTVKDFFIQENSKDAVLDLLASKLEAADSFEVLEKPSLGQCLVAKFVDDSCWYRGKVINQDPIEVLFLDYGNVSPATEFRVLPLELAAFPLLCWHCSVNIENTPIVNDHFNSLVDANTVFEVSFEAKEGDLHVVQLYVNNESPFELSATSGAEKSEISSSAVEQIPALQVKPISPALIKPVYKNCELCHSNGPYDFYVQTDDDHIQIDEMANALFEAGTFPKVDSVKKGDFVVAQFTEDDAYYRAIVTDVEPEVVVHFIDYGNSCPASCFHELPTPLKEIPQLAIRCSLQSPIGGWSVDAIDKFTSLLNPETKSIDLKVISRGDPNTVDVEVNGSSITKQLAPDAKFEANSIPESPSAVDDVQLPSSGLCYVALATPKECYIQESSSSADLEVITEQLAAIDMSDANNELKDVEVGDLVGACHEDVLYRARITKLDPPEVYFVDYGNTSPVTKFFKLPETINKKEPLAMKVKLDLGEGVELNDDGVAELQNLAVDGANYTQTRPSVVELSIGGSKLTDLLKSYLVIADSEPKTSTSAPVTTNTVDEAEYVPITISHVNSPLDFYYQLDISKVDEMSSRLTDTEGFLSIEKCEVGQVVCGKYSEDELWYRAKILTTEPSVSVMFLDYGNTSEIEEMKHLPDDLAKIPPLCVRASLKPLKEQWTEEKVNKFLEIAYGSADFTCSVIENGTDVVITRLNSSEVGDVASYLERSCSIKSSDSEYGTPEALSVNDVVPSDQYDETGSISSSLIDEQIASLVSLVPDKEVPLQLTSYFTEKVQSDGLVEPEVDKVYPSETENSSTSNISSTNSEPSSVIHSKDAIEIPINGCEESGDCLAFDTNARDHNELGSTDVLSMLAKENQATPTKNSVTSPESLVFNNETDLAMDTDGIHTKEDLSDDAMDKSDGKRENSEFLNFSQDGEIIRAVALPSTDSEPRAQGNIETLGESSPTEAFEDVGLGTEQLAESQDVDVGRQSIPISTKSIMMSEATALVPFFAESSARFTNPIELSDQIKEVASPSLDSPSTIAKQQSQSSESGVPVQVIPCADVLPSKTEISETLVSDESQNVPVTCSYFRLPDLKGTLRAVMECNDPETSTSFEHTVSDSPNLSDTIIPSESETCEENSQSEIMNSSTDVHASTSFSSFSESSAFHSILEEESYFADQSLVESVKELATRHVSNYDDGLLVEELSVKPTAPLNVIPVDKEPVVGIAVSVVEQDTSLDKMCEADLCKKIDSSRALADLASQNAGGLKTAEELLISQPLPTSVVCIAEEDDSKPGLPSDTNETDIPSVAPVADVSGHELLLIGEQLGPAAHIEAQKHLSVPSDLDPHSAVFDSEFKQDSTESTSRQDLPMTGMTPEEFLSSFRTIIATRDELLAEYLDDFMEELSDADEPEITQPALAPTKDEGKITVPSHVVETSEDRKTELNVTDSIVMVDPVVPAHTIHTETEVVETSTVSKENEMASMKPAAKTSSTIAEPSKRIPVKTLAQIKASAKPRISTGRPASSNSKNKPPSKSGSPSTPSMSRKLSASAIPPPESTTSSPGSTRERDRIIPGTVNGRLV